MNCPLAEAFTKTPSVVYQNFLREFWCTAIAYDSNPPINDSKARPLKEYLIKFLVMNEKKPLILDYAKGTYVSHPSPEAVKAELAKIVENPILLDRTPVLKNSFPVAWRILFTFVIQVLSGNYSSTEQINYIHQMIAYCLITGTKVDIGETGRSFTDETFRSSPTILSNSNFSKDPSKVTEIELTASMIAVNKQKDLVSPLPFSGKKKKVKSQTVTPPTGPMEGSEQSHSVSSGNVPDPQDLERNIQLVGTGSPFTSLDEGIRKSQPLSKSKTTDPKNLGETFSPLIKDCLLRLLMKVRLNHAQLREGPRGTKNS
ncbi:hypothetical protein Tco_0948745 [Tanacetum coccineum]